MKKFITFILACMLTLPSIITYDSSSAVTKATTLTYNVTLSVGETKSVSLPNKAYYKKYYSSTESSARVSSYGTKGKKNFTLKGVKATEKNKPVTVTVTTSAGRKVKYKVTVQNDASAGNDSSPSTSNVAVTGDCPYCQGSDCLQKKSVTYTRPAVMTAYVKEPIKSYSNCYNIELLNMSERDFEQYIAELGGVICTTSYSSFDKKYLYNVLLPLKAHPIYGYNDGSDGSDSTSSFWGGGFQANFTGYYLSEFIVEDVQAEPAKSVNLDSGLIECTKCGYVGKQK